ncbi:hypothetical protein [Kitasatospora indigofera]|uniref:hypothetical protein n=1 Tax=Kitasatospora indigofera TaxID=67307 RepID=UPI00339E784C
MSAVQEQERRCLPQPEFPYPLGHVKAGTVRWSCPLGCGRHHDEYPGLDPVGPIVLPGTCTEADGGWPLSEVLITCTDAELSRAITASATARADARNARVLAALDGHAQEHAGGSS